ncbi:MAG: hypothetical protein AAGE94_08745 [Acidobacteriota bacterium]
MKRLMFPLVLVAALFVLLPAAGLAQVHVGLCTCEVCAEYPWNECSKRGVGTGPCGMYLYLFCWPAGEALTGGDLEGVATWRQPTFADLLLDAAPAAHEDGEVEPQEQPAAEMPDAVLRETVATSAVG